LPWGYPYNWCFVQQQTKVSLHLVLDHYHDKIVRILSVKILTFIVVIWRAVRSGGQDNTMVEKQTTEDHYACYVRDLELIRRRTTDSFAKSSTIDGSGSYGSEFVCVRVRRLT